MKELKNGSGDVQNKKSKGTSPSKGLSEQEAKSGFKGTPNSSNSKNNSKTKSIDPNVDEYNFAGIKYRTPGKRQRIIVASVVLSLNVLLGLSVLLYFKNPGFKDLIFNLGR